MATPASLSYGETARPANTPKTTKAIMHPTVGEINVDCDVLTAGSIDLKIVVLTAPPGSDDASKIELARISALTFAQ